MALSLPDKWVWDFWFALDGDRHHVFYLQAPRSLGRSDLRHRNASIGHAVSTDLRAWTVLPDALAPGEPGSWDDLATWTGSVIERDGRWHMLYTGISTNDSGLIQRIGLATSDDLVHWTKHPANPVLEADGRWYELLDLTRWRDQSWRDPWLFVEPDGAGVHVLLTARSPRGPADGAGVIAHARSADFVHWEVLPPLTDTLLVADRFRSAVMALHQEPSQAISGHEADGAASKDHQHAFWWRGCAGDHVGCRFWLRRSP